MAHATSPAGVIRIPALALIMQGKEDDVLISGPETATMVSILSHRAIALVSALAGAAMLGLSSLGPA
jgi:hypothetical protein